MSRAASDYAALRPYCTNLDRPVFALRGLPEEVVAVLFAYYSRSTDSLRDNLLKLLDDGDLALVGGAPAAAEDDPEWLQSATERARQFHEKWVVGYGHSSVAEHAVVHLAVEQISIVATKALEDNRLASYTEKSTRYVQFDQDSFVRDPAIAASPLAADYEAVCRALLQTYTELMPIVQQQFAERFPRPDDWTERRHAAVCRAQACDLLRYLLPASTATNVGLTVNGRALEHLLTKLYSSPLGELRALAEALRSEAVGIVPTLLKYAAPNDYLQQTPGRIAAEAARLLELEASTETANRVQLVAAPEDPYATLATAILYEQTGLSYEACRSQVAALARPRQLEVIDAYLVGRGRHDQPLRALEHLVYSFEIALDYGAFRDIQRHRMCTQTGQVLGSHLGYETPDGLAELGHEAVYHQRLSEAAELHRRLVDEVGPEAAQYVLPLAFRKRVLITWNLRELHHFIQLRSAHQGHVSYRRVAQDCWRELDRVHPELARPIRVDLELHDLARG